MSRFFSILRSTSKRFIFPRLFTQQTPERCTDSRLETILKNRFPKAKVVEVEDVSGGCGDMFKIYVETSEFAGNSILKQHKMITETLKDEIKNMHGLTIHTAVPKSS